MGRRGGYSLIEVAVAMTLLGLALGAYLQHFVAQREKARYEVTQKRLEEVRTALTAYAAQKGRLPCPGSPEAVAAPVSRQSRFSSKSTDKEEGCEEGSEPQKGIIVFRAEGNPDQKVPEVWTGVLPARELRLNDEQAYDGWGRLFTYAVSRGLTLKDGLRGNPLPPGVISVEGAAGNNLLEMPNTGRYVVVSHGPSGAGGWSPGGGRKACDKKALDGRNCDGDADFVSALYAPVRGKSHYDDLVIFDDLDAGGSLLDKLVKCNAKKKFYLPGEEHADEDGCQGFLNVIEGACLIKLTLMPSGSFSREPPVVVMKPSVAQGPDCGCEEGYSTIELGTWDVQDLVTVSDTQTQSGGSTVGGAETVYVRSSLYVCAR